MTRKQALKYGPKSLIVRCRRFLEIQDDVVEAIACQIVPEIERVEYARDKTPLDRGFGRMGIGAPRECDFRQRAQYARKPRPHC